MSGILATPSPPLTRCATCGMGMMLVLYCLAFLLPSALLTALAARGTTVNALSRLLADRMPLVKWATAALFAVVMLVMWL